MQIRQDVKHVAMVFGMSRWQAPVKATSTLRAGGRVRTHGLLQRMSPLLARSRGRGMSAIPLLSGGKQTSSRAGETTRLTHKRHTALNWLWRFTLHLATEKRTQPSATGPAFFPELSDPRSPEKDRIQLVHALTMSMGLEWVEATPSTGDNNDEVRMHMAPDPCRYVLSLPATALQDKDSSTTPAR